MTRILCEVCIDACDGALAAEKAGAHRLELCGSLVEGGITPSAGLVQQVKSKTNLPIHILIRPRGGDFYYSPSEFDTMRDDIAFALSHNVEGIVIGLLNTDGTIDQKRMELLIADAGPMSVTFHRAFDMTSNPSRALETLISLGVDRLLTSGCAPTVDEGQKLIKQLVDQADNRIIIMPGGGINEKNTASLIKETGVCEIHFSARSQVNSPMIFHNSALNLNDNQPPSDYTRKTTDPTRLNAIIESISNKTL